MAAPPEITCANLNGKFVMTMWNKTLSDEIDSMLALQGISWFTRKAIGLATVVLTIKQYTDEAGVHIDITSVAAGVTSTQEDRTLDWEDRENVDKVFGKVRGKSRFWKTGEFQREGPGDEQDDTFLRGEKLKDLKTDSKFLDDEHVQSYVVNLDAAKWTGEQNWAFEEVNGQRHYTRRVVVRRGDGVQRARLVYDYLGPAEKAED